MSEPENLTPAHLLCAVAASCPSIYRLGDGKLLVVGKRDVDCLYLRNVAIGDDEQAVIISPDLLDSLKAEWAREAIGQAASGVTSNRIRRLRRTPLYYSHGGEADALTDEIADALEASQAEVERLREALTLRPMNTAPKEDRAIIWAKFKDDMAPYNGRTDQPDWHTRWQGRWAPVRHEGITHPGGYDMGWSIALPVRHVGLSDEWFEGWLPLPARAVLSSPVQKDKEPQA